MYCPFKFNSTTLDWEGAPRTCECEKANCALWNTPTGTCAIATLAYLRGVEEERAEMQDTINLHKEAH